MSGNGRGPQRPQSRPPFLVIGLLVALSILGFNYWNLSSANGTLSATNIDLQDQIRILTSKKLNEEQSKRQIERKYNLLEQRISAKDSEIKGLQDDVEIKKAAQEKAESVKNECNTNLQTCETNNSGIQQQLADVNLQLDELKKKQDQPPNCDSQCKEQTKKLYYAMFDKVGAQVMQHIINAGIDVGDDLKIQVQQAASNVKQIQPPDQKIEQQKKTEGNKNALQPASSETKKDDANPKTDDKNKEGDTQKTGDVSKVEDKNTEIKGGNKSQDGKTVITVNGAPQAKPPQDKYQQEDKNGRPVKDDGYDDEEEVDNKLGNDQVEGNRNLKFIPKDKKKIEDSIDALGKRLNN